MLTKRTTYLGLLILIISLIITIAACEMRASNGVYEYTIDSTIIYIEEGNLEIHAVDPVFMK